MSLKLLRDLVMKQSKSNKFSELFQGGISAVSAKLKDVAKKVKKIITWDSSDLHPMRGEDAHDQIEAWKMQGRELYKLGRSVLEEKQRHLNGASGVTPSMYDRRKGRILTAYTGDLTAEAMRDSSYEGRHAVSLCLLGESARFWGEKEHAFCAHYLMNSEDKYDLYLRGFSREGSLLVAKVNNNSLTREQVESCDPVFVVTKSPEGYKITFALLEYEYVYADGAEHKYNEVLSISEYLIGFQHDTFNATHVRNNRLPYEGNAIYTPLSITRMSSGDIVVLGRSVGDSRVPSTNQGYFAWMFSAETLELLKVRGDHTNSYFFSRVGGSSAEFPERLLIWDDVRDHISLTYISTYLASEGARFFSKYKAHSADFPAYSRSAVDSLMRSPDRCFIETPRCNIEAIGISLSEEHIEYIQGISVNGARYIVYIVRPWDNKRMGKLCVASFSRGMYEVLQNIVPIKFLVSSLNVKAEDDHLGVMIVEKDAGLLHMYDLRPSQLHAAGKCDINTVTKDIANLSAEDFINIADKGTKIISQSMRKVSSARSIVSVTRGQMAGIPVSRKSKFVLRVVEYAAVKEISTTASTQHSVERASSGLRKRGDVVIAALPVASVTQPMTAEYNSRGNVVATRGAANVTIVSTRAMNDKASGDATTYASVPISGIGQERKVCSTPGGLGCIGNASDEGERAVIEAPQEQVFTEPGISTTTVKIRGDVEDTTVVTMVKHNSTMESGGNETTTVPGLSTVTQQSVATVDDIISDSSGDKFRRDIHSNMSVTTSRPCNGSCSTASQTPLPMDNKTIAPTEAIYKTDMVSSAMAASSIAILLLAVILVVACLLYVRWRTGSFVQTRGMYRHIYEEGNARRTRRGGGGLNTDVGMHNIHPDTTFARVDGATSGFECVTTQEL
ncbi:hypothetical protein [Candidatus Anaplasma sp. TIGMIC]|uniref:hypothetical protein n=1 Tax=Candidatus Anaplasma sp. TIGMIC TaxID=3020713 RepID=UPI00232BF861|nr:hypothetical protein [Candidatus Anaplasma sp. TIGMIC]MDB1135755.1 hypothetical protein [Candidatus Anaplasma sp. TIGMIC]